MDVNDPDDAEPVRQPGVGTDAVDGRTRTAVAVSRLSSLSELPLAEHAEVFQSIHGELQDALAEIDTD